MELLTADEYRSPSGRVMVRGTQFSVTGERGRFRFRRYVLNELGQEWIDCYGGPGWRDGQGVMASRSFTPDRIKTVHWKDKVHPRVGGKKGS